MIPGTCIQEYLSAPSTVEASCIVSCPETLDPCSAGALIRCGAQKKLRSVRTNRKREHNIRSEITAVELYTVAVQQRLEPLTVGVADGKSQLVIDNLCYYPRIMHRLGGSR